ncbi:MAG: carotenoid biosynthesis protein [Vicingaceae bacterium]
MTKHKSLLAIAVLIIFYTVGIVGLGQAHTREFFLILTPFNLLLTAGVYIWGNGNYGPRFLLLFLLITAFGIAVEILGVHTGLLFGIYEYGHPLGFKFLNVPLIIGVNWSILILSANGLLKNFTSHKLLRAATAAFLVTSLDVLIEPVAVHLDFWHWENQSIPLQNYLMWFITALLLEMLVEFFNVNIESNVSTGVFFIQVAFFGLLNLMV